MSNKPLKLRPKGLTLQPPEPEKPYRLPEKWKGWISGERGRRIAAQTARSILLCLLCVSYALGLSDPATAVVARKRELPVYCVERADKALSISFDASWGADKTLDILDILDAHEVKTTFFLVGSWVEKYPDMLREIVARGHEIGNHSDTHAHMNRLNAEQIARELRDMSDRVEAIIGTRPTLFRPPYGEYNDRVVATSRAEGYECVQWSVDSLDWKDRGTADIVKQCTYRIDNGDIVLFHNDSNDIVNALPTVLKHYQSLGYQIIPVSKLLLEGETTIDIQGKQHPASPKQ